MNGNSLVSVVIATYNARPYLTRAIESVLSQTYRPVEIIVVDDGSTDGTATALTQYRNRIRYVFQRNRGPAAARNRAIAHARGELIGFLDADDVWMPHKLARQAMALSASHDIGLSHTNLLEIDSDGRPRAGHLHPCRFFSGRCYETFFFHNLGPSSGVVVKRECLDRLGTFDENLTKPTCEDYDLWWRIARFYELNYIDEPLYHYRVHATNGSKDLHAMDEAVRYVLLKRLARDPSLTSRVGAAAVSQRLSRLYCDLGYAYVRRREIRRAIESCIRAASYDPTYLRGWRILASAFIPPPILEGLKTLRQLRA